MRQASSMALLLDDEDFASPSITIKLPYDIKRLVSIKLAEAIVSGNSQVKQDCEEFLKLMTISWSTKLAKVALETNPTVRRNCCLTQKTFRN